MSMYGSCDLKLPNVPCWNLLYGPSNLLGKNLVTLEPYRRIERIMRIMVRTPKATTNAMTIMNWDTGRSDVAVRTRTLRNKTTATVAISNTRSARTVPRLHEKVFLASSENASAR